MIKHIDIQDIPARDKRRGGVILNDIKQFLQSGDDACEIVIDPGRKVATVTATYHTVNKRLGSPVIVSQRENRVFLIKKGSSADAE